MTMHSDPWLSVWNTVTIVAIVVLALCCCFCDLMQDTLLDPEDQQTGGSVTADLTPDADIELETQVTIDRDADTTQRTSIYSDP